MKGWENNVVSFFASRDAGACPKCGGKNVTAEEYFFGDRRSLTFICKDCGSFDHFDGFVPKGKQGNKA